MTQGGSRAPPTRPVESVHWSRVDVATAGFHRHPSAVTFWEEYGSTVLKAGSGAVPDDAAERFRASLSGDSLFAGVCGLARLDLASAQALAVLTAVEVLPELQQHVGAVHGEPLRQRLTLGALAQLFPSPHPGALIAAESGRLRRAAYVDVETTGPWSLREVSAAPALVWALCGDSSPDPDLPPGANVIRGVPAVPDTKVLHLLSGGDRISRRNAAITAVGGLGLLVTRPPTSWQEWDAVIREASVGGLGILLELGVEVPPDLADVLARADHLAWSLSSPADLPLSDLPDRPRRDVQVPDPVATAEEWSSFTGAPAPQGVLLDRHQLQLIALTDAPVPEAVRRLAGGHLDRLAQRVRPRRTWDDLVLPEPLKAQVRGLVSRHLQRRVVYDEWGFPGLPSRGTVALLAGPSGTGKTLTAEVVAGELGLDLFVLELSSVMSKYIGDTEKNLDALFDAAETGDVVLFFDEADALFGKRSAVNDARDRYANVGVSYLLQRLERHDGLILLATNLPNNIDTAFLRRLHANLEFTAPGPEERRGIWERAFPASCPVESLDLDRLAAEELAGGAISTAAVTAAFAAAGEGRPVMMEHVLAAVAAEYRKLGRLALPTPNRL